MRLVRDNPARVGWESGTTWEPFYRNFYGLTIVNP
jgi:hypothetical protein